MSANVDQIVANLDEHLITPLDMKNDEQCTICLDNYIIKDKAKQMPCGHFYHEQCLR
eukprot:CAMPEP_0115012854 /NCGR_PEP_ID=MMETSP0216-20121206/25011_1 /TAXON_ID=223996 /ORGANISM="Protocruzia adherens, Strain Boccale" /LENGTH=56 /DNA_ID=CAMNT_0002382043 /DNA_START=492 /DNA_END=658 /DNA_ORIENTATION=+